MLPSKILNSILPSFFLGAGGLMVESIPATDKMRVRFPPGAS